MENEEKIITFADLGIKLEEMNLKVGIEVPICCEKEMLLCMPFNTITDFIQDICEDDESRICMAILQDMSYICGAKHNGKMYKFENEEISYANIIPLVIKSCPQISSLVIIQHVSNEDGHCYFKVVTE